MVTKARAFHSSRSTAAAYVADTGSRNGALSGRARSPCTLFTGGSAKRNLVMKLRTVLLAVASASALSTAAFAANPHDTNHPSSREQLSSSCSALETQYNSIIEGKLGTPVSDRAEGLHAQGVNACENNNPDVGVDKLHEA